MSAASGTRSSWICCQLGAREHYAVPRALARAGALTGLITDVWAAPSLLTRYVYPRRARERYHSELETAAVWSHAPSSFLGEIPRRSKNVSEWDRIVSRNDQFQQLALRDLRRFAARHPGANVRLFSFSYTARQLFEFAKAQGWTTVLGQIDGGPGEERIVGRLHESAGALASRWQPAPARYWAAWRDECALADTIVVNSRWSRQLLVEEGVRDSTIQTVPLAYERSSEQVTFTREYPERFTASRPLRVLFLGQIVLRKGIAPLLDAVLELVNDPVEFWFVGPSEIEIPEVYQRCQNARWHGAVARGEVDNYYKQADVLIFPTFSDGFGITQLEAQAWKLPIIASRFCGDVVHDGLNGVILPGDVTGSAIVQTLRALMSKPDTLSGMSRQAVDLDSFSIDRLSARMATLS